MDKKKTYYLDDLRHPQSQDPPAKSREVKSVVMDGNPFNYESNGSNLTEKVDNILKKANGLQGNKEGFSST